MQTLICQEPGNLQYIQRPYPEKVSGESIIRIQRIGICGTDLHAYDGTQPFFTYPRVLGHELAATYVEGDAPGFSAGDALTLIPYYHCGSCIACRQGKTNCCASLQVCGVHVDGGMTEYLSVPSHLLVAAAGLSLDQLALVEPLAIGAHAVSRAGAGPGDQVLVVGAGPIGLGIAQFARISGARVIVMDTNEDRLEFSRNWLQGASTINPLSENTEEQLRELTGGDMPSVVLDATGNRTAINNAFSYLSHAGKYVLVGLQMGEVSFSHPEFHKREATLMSSRNATRADVDWVMQSIQNGDVDPLLLVSHRIRFDELKDRFSSLSNPAEKTIKALVEC